MICIRLNHANGKLHPELMYSSNLLMKSLKNIPFVDKHLDSGNAVRVY